MLYCESPLSTLVSEIPNHILRGITLCTYNQMNYWFQMNFRSFFSGVMQTNFGNLLLSNYLDILGMMVKKNMPNIQLSKTQGMYNTIFTVGLTKKHTIINSYLLECRGMAVTFFYSHADLLGKQYPYFWSIYRGTLHKWEV